MYSEPAFTLIVRVRKEMNALKCRTLAELHECTSAS